MDLRGIGYFINNNNKIAVGASQANTRAQDDDASRTVFGENVIRFAWHLDYVYCIERRFRALGYAEFGRVGGGSYRYNLSLFAVVVTRARALNREFHGETRHRGTTRGKRSDRSLCARAGSFVRSLSLVHVAVLPKKRAVNSSSSAVNSTGGTS